MSTHSLTLIITAISRIENKTIRLFEIFPEQADFSLQKTIIVI